MARLEVYVAEDCWSCEETQRIVADVAPQFPGIEIELLDLNNNRKHPDVFATPTYVLNGRIIFLGNPTREQLKQSLTAVQKTRQKL